MKKAIKAILKSNITIERILVCILFPICLSFGLISFVNSKDTDKNVIIFKGDKYNKCFKSSKFNIDTLVEPGGVYIVKTKTEMTYYDHFANCKGLK